MHKTAIIRCEHFNVAHKLRNKNWDNEKNRTIFGECNSPNYHWHNYDLEVKTIGFCDPETGYVIDTKNLSSLIKDKILDRFDYKNLNLDIAQFVELNPTAENIAMVIYKILRAELEEHLKLKITLRNSKKLCRISAQLMHPISKKKDVT